MRKPCLMWVALLAFASAGAEAATILVTWLEDAPGTCPSASECTLRAAIAAAMPNDRIEFDPGFILPAIVTLQGTELSISKNLTIVGPGADRLSVRAASNRRVLTVNSGSVVIERLELANGRLITTNGLSGMPGTGNAGLGAGIAEGGCVNIGDGTSRLVLNQVAIRNCDAQAGNGGDGGSGVRGAPPGNGGSGGMGGLARGGAIATRGELMLLNSSVAGAVLLGGAGGAGGDGGDGITFSTSEGDGGNGGNSGTAQGGAIYVGVGGALLIRNSTLLGNSVATGNGGPGGNGGNGAAAGIGAGGNGGIAADAEGGQVFMHTTLEFADIEFSSLGSADMTAGLGGARGLGNPNGTIGQAGLRYGESVSVFAGTAPRIRSSVLVGSNVAVDCFGAITASGNNADSDDSCAGFTRQGTFAGNFRGPAIDVEGGRVVMLPLPSSIAIDAATNCNDLAGAAVTSDQSGRTRPLDGDGNGSALCDLGAVEFDFRLFSNGFE